VHWFWRYVSCLMHKRFIQKRPSGSKNWGLLAQCECTGKHRNWDVNWIHCKQYTGYDQLLTEIRLIFELLDIRSILNNSMMEFGAQTIFKEFKQCTNNLVRPVRPNAQHKKNMVRCQSIIIWQCVKTNCTPSVHIKIAGIYGCSFW